LALERLVDLLIVQFLVAAELDGADARALFHDRADDHALLALIGLDADVVEETGLPEVDEVALHHRRLIRLAGDDAEVNADGVACNGSVTSCLEALDGLPGQIAADVARLRRRRCIGDPAAG